MDIFSKFLDRGAMNKLFGIHPLANAPLITHVGFADVALLFFGGTNQSLSGLLTIMENFNKCSSLVINKSKTSVIFDGGDQNRNRASALAHGLSQWSFLVRYLGVSLMT